MPGVYTRVLRRHDFAFSPGAIVKGLSMTSPHGPSKIERVRAYHELSKHRVDGYAPGPRGLDWATQPDPFRRFEGSPTYELPLDAGSLDLRFSALHRPGAVAPAALGLLQIGLLLQLSLGLSAWKSQGTSRWPLRCNPSSGNLHPTEGYLICPRLDGLDAGLYHYCSRDHLLEQRASVDSPGWSRALGDNLVIGLSAVHWREAWKYGERAYRYCMHDAGHALGALSIAAAGLGWQTRLLDDIGTEGLAALLGTSQVHDAEQEEPDLLLVCMPMARVPPLPALSAAALQACAALAWQGQPNRLSPSHVDWGIEAFAARLRQPRTAGAYETFAMPPRSCSPLPRAVALRRMIRQRRSAVAMDGETRIACETFYRMLDRTLAAPGAVPFSTLPWKSQLHLALLVHRVDDLPRGLYLLVRDPAQLETLQAALTRAEHWRKPPGCPETLPLYCLIEADARNAAREISCQQDIASDGCFAVAMLAGFDAPLERYGPWFYPRLYWEAGVIGQLLYLEAEAAGIRSTGIGCFFDDALHELLGLQDRRFQDLYHFTVGGAVEDKRLTTLPAYTHDRDVVV